MIRRLLCWLGWHEWGCVCSLYKNCQRIKTLKCRVFNIRCKHCGKERDELGRLERR
nr:MAG TPA: Sarcosine oxidase, delta subunit family [Caudoviricetes sp.]